MSQDFMSVDYEKITLRITKFISENVKSRKKSGVVIGLSGGLDSSVCLVLAAKALDKNRIMGLIMPERGFTPQIDIDNAFELAQDRKSTRLNSSHSQISYAVFCLKKKKIKIITYPMK